MPENRREFLKISVMLAGAGVVPGCSRVFFPENPDGRVYSNSPNIPATLDLADHGRMAINGILGSLNPDVEFESVFYHILDVHPPYMLHWSTMVSGVMPKYIEALPMLRTMSGSRQDLDIQEGFLQAMLRNAEDDGLVYDRADETRPWNVGVYYGRPDWNEDYANMAGNGRLISGFTFWHQLPGDDIWKRLARRSAERMLDLVIEEGDYAYYPNPGLGNDFSYPRESGWITRDPPERSNEGFEGATLFYLLQPVRGFMRYYQLSGDERFLDVSRKFVRFGTQPKLWGAVNDMKPPSGAERGHFTGHFHGRLAALRGMLDYAVLAGDARVQLMVRDSYEWARQRGIHRLGVFPHTYEYTEGCTLGDMTCLSVALTDAGLGDYWDDVEMYSRNGLICLQATDLDELKRVSEAGKYRPPESNWGGFADSRFGGNNRGVLPKQELHDHVLKRAIGAFGHLQGARFQFPLMMACCTANCSQGLYHAWEGILRKSGRDAVDVNMWLNRRSPWLDIWSWLPYEGRLMLYNKGMTRITIRKPAWARPSRIRCRVNGVDAVPAWSGNRMLLTQLRGNEIIELETEVTRDRGSYTLVNLHAPHESKEQYTCEFHGHTAISAVRIRAGRDPGEPYSENLDWYRLFRREHMRASHAPMKAMPAHIPPHRIIKCTIT